MENSRIYNVSDYGALADGVTNDTKAINAAVCACDESGGGIVYFAPGYYAAEYINLKSKRERESKDGWHPSPSPISCLFRYVQSTILCIPKGYSSRDTLCYLKWSASLW